MATTLLSAGITMGSSTLSPGGSAPSFTCRAWVNFNGTGAVSIRGSGNVSSITDGGLGNFTVNFATAMPDTNYAEVAITTNGGSTNYNTSAIALGLYTSSTRTTSARQFFPVGITGTANVVFDPDGVFFAVFR